MSPCGRVTCIGWFFELLYYTLHTNSQDNHVYVFIQLFHVWTSESSFVLCSNQNKPMSMDFDPSHSHQDIVISITHLNDATNHLKWRILLIYFRWLVRWFSDSQLTHKLFMICKINVYERQSINLTSSWYDCLSSFYRYDRSEQYCMWSTYFHRVFHCFNVSQLTQELFKWHKSPGFNQTPSHHYTIIWLAQSNSTTEFAWLWIEQIHHIGLLVVLMNHKQPARCSWSCRWPWICLTSIVVLSCS